MTIILLLWVWCLAISANEIYYLTMDDVEYDLDFSNLLGLILVFTVVPLAFTIFEILRAFNIQKDRRSHQ